MTKPPCSIESCEKPSKTRGWCSMHYERWRVENTTTVRRRKPCSIAGCARPAAARGWCTTHWRRWRLYGDPHATARPKPVGCKAEGCDGNHYARDYCRRHYLRLQKYGSATAGQRKLGVGARIAQRAVSDGDCLIYQTRRQTRSGHVTIFRDGRYVGVHRAAWELANGPVPEGLYVLHRCDRPRCVNVDHLFLGTIADNNADRDRKGRHVALPGSANGFAKLDEAGVAQIKARLAGGESTYALADEFGVSQATVWSIKVGRAWKHVEAAALDGVHWPKQTVAVAR